MRNSINLYKFVALLSIVTTAISVITILVTIGNSGSLITIQTNSTTGSSNVNSTAVLGASSALSAVSGLVGFVSFILVLVSWLRWREGIRTVDSSAGEYGMEHQASAHAAKSDYDWTVYTFFMIIIAAIGAAVGVVAFVLESLDVGSAQKLTNAQMSSFATGLLTIILVLVVIFAVLNFMMYYFSTRSLKRTFYGLADGNLRRELDSARTLSLWGAALNLIPVVGGLLLFLGLSKFEKAYNTWLANPPGTNMISQGSAISSLDFPRTMV